MLQGGGNPEADGLAQDRAAGGVEEDEAGFTARLNRAWLNERNAPALLPFQFELVQDCLELLQNQARARRMLCADGW